MIADLLYYGVPSAVIAVTVWVGVLGWRFYVQNVLRDTDGEATDVNQETP